MKTKQTRYMENNDNKLDIEIPHDVAKGSYSNLAIITHSHSEFILDFATMLPGLQKASVSNRLIMTPEHAKRLLMALQDNVQKYEAQYGPIAFGRNNGNDTFPMGGMGGFGNGAKS